MHEQIAAMMLEYFIPSTYGTIITALILIICTLLYVYHKTTYSYWRKRGVPEISWKPFPLLGHAYNLFMGKSSFNEFAAELYKGAEGKPFVGYYQGARPHLLVCDPELMRHILVKDFPKFVNRGFEIDEKIDPLNGKSLAGLKDQRWKEMRTKLSPTFTSGRMRAMFHLMKSCTDIMEECISEEIKKSPDGAVLEVKEMFCSFTTDVIAACAFGVESDSLRQPETSIFRKMGQKLFEVTFWRAFFISLLFISPSLIGRLGIKFTLNETEVFFRNFVKDVIEKREKLLEEQGDTKQFGDFIHMLALLKKHGVHALVEKDGTFDAEHENLIKTESSSQTDMSLDSLTSQVLLFFTAGFENTSSLLSYALFELSYTENGKEIQRKLRKEVLKSMKENGNKILYDGLKKIPLLENVVSETLRLHPPGGALSRVSSESYTLPGTDITLDKGTAIFIPILGMHLDAKYFPDPKKFDPDRFTPENKNNRNHYVYQPFGDGPRVCIAQRFVLMQAELGLASLLSKFKFEVCTEKTTIPFKYSARSFATTPKGGIWIKFTELPSNEQ